MDFRLAFICKFIVFQLSKQTLISRFKKEDWKQMEAISKDMEAVNRIREKYLEGLEAIKAERTTANDTAENNLRASAITSDMQSKVEKEIGTTFSWNETGIEPASIEDYNEKKYNKRGWARVNAVISATENRTLSSRLSDKKNRAKFPRSADGKYLFAVGERDGVNNVVIVSDGNYVDPSIDRVYRIDLDNETDIEIVRNEIYEQESRDSSRAGGYVQQIFGDELVGIRVRHDMPTYGELRSEKSRSKGSGSKKNQRHFNFEQDGSGDTGEAERTGINTDIRTSQMSDVDDAELEAQTPTESAPKEPKIRYPMRYDIPEGANIQITAKGRDSLEQADIDAFNRGHS